MNKKINLIFLFFVLTSSLSTSLFGKSSSWNQVVEISLKKDEFQEIKIFDKIKEKQLFFRWTLFINNGLVVISHYDKYPHQYILYPNDFRQDSFITRLSNRKESILIQFNKFDFKLKKANFTIYSKSNNIEIVESKKDLNK